jgi:hypothetical protein
MKHFCPSWLLLLCWGAAPVASIAAVTPPSAVETAPNNRVQAPQSGFYLINDVRDCQLGKTYVFGSSIFTKGETVLDQTSTGEHQILGQTDLHFVNGCFILPTSLPKSATWTFERDEKHQLNHLVNAATHLEMAVWNSKAKQSKDKFYDIFTIDPKKAKSRDIDRAMRFEELPLKHIEDRTCDLPVWIAPSFYDDSYKNFTRLVEWTNMTYSGKFRSYDTKYVYKIRTAIFPPRIFRYYAKGELLPALYAETKQITFEEAGYRTFFAECAYTCPDDVKAYRGVVNGQNLELFPIGKVIPANTAVILYKSAPGDATLRLTFEDTPRLNEKNDLWPTRRNINEDEAKGSPYGYYGLTSSDDAPKNWRFAKIQSSIPQGKAVLAFDKKINSSVTPRIFNFIIHEKPIITGLHEQTAAGSPKVDQQMWDLQGHPLLHPRHREPYIQGGKLKMGE